MPSGSFRPEAIFFLVWLTIWSFGTAGLMKGVYYAWRRPIGVTKVFSAVFITAFSVPFIGAEIFVSLQLIKMTSLSMFFVVLSAVVINWLFYELLNAGRP